MVDVSAKASAVLEITKMMNEYCYCIDEARLEDFSELFRRGTYRIVEAVPTVMHGKDEILAWCKRVMVLHDGKTYTRHLTSNADITVIDEKNAKSRCYIHVLQMIPERFALQVIYCGYYEDKFACDEDGWYWVERAVRPDFRGNISQHSARVPGTKA